MSSEVQLPGNEMLNKKVLSSRRNVRNDEAVRRVFYARAAATAGNARSPRSPGSPGRRHGQSRRRARP